MKEVFIFSVFLVVLYLVSFSNLAYSAINYNKLFINTYVKQQNSNEIGLDKVIFKFLLTKFKNISYLIADLNRLRV